MKIIGTGVEGLVGVRARAGSRRARAPERVPAGYQTLTTVTDFCDKTDAFRGPGEDTTLAWDDPELAVPWPAPVIIVGQRDRNGQSRAEHLRFLGVA